MTVGILSCLGLLAGILSVLLPTLLTERHSPIFVGSRLGVFPGDVFGAALSIYFLVFAGIRSVWKAVGLIIASTFAYFVAFCSGFFLGMVVSEILGLTMNAGDPELSAGMVPPLLIAGTVGAFLLLMSVLRMYAAENSWRRILVRSCFWSLPGGLLAVIGWGLGPGLGRTVWSALARVQLNAGGQDVQWAAHAGILNGYSLDLVWQAGMGILIGLFLSETPLLAPRAHERTDSTRKLNLVNTSLFAVMVVALAWYVSINLSSEYREMLWQRAYARHEAEKPSFASLPPIEVAPAETMLILGPIGEYLPGHPSTGQGHTIKMPAPQVYVVRYSLPGTPGSGANVGPHVDVQVKQWPNAAWARWALEEENFSPGLNQVEQIVRFGNRILLKRAGAETLFAWPSGDRFIILEVYSADAEAFIQQYLQKYPSSL